MTSEQLDEYQQSIRGFRQLDKVAKRLLVLVASVVLVCAITVSVIAVQSFDTVASKTSNTNQLVRCFDKDVRGLLTDFSQGKPVKVPPPC